MVRNELASEIVKVVSQVFAQAHRLRKTLHMRTTR